MTTPLDFVGVLAALESHALSTGRFERVNLHEPKNAPGKGLTLAIWANNISPAAVASGLSVTTAYIEFNLRVFTPMLMEPQDAIDPRVLEAVDVLMAAYASDFTLGGRVRNVDLLGAHGPGLRAQAGYITVDKTVFRVMTITLPILINDAWEQVA